jgi:hypothetical protein
MTRKVINANQAQTTVGDESTFGTVAGTLKRIYPKEGISLQISQQEVEDMSESIYLFDQKDTVSGYKSGEAKINMYLAPSGSAIAVSDVPAYTNSGDSIILKNVFGGYAASGSSGISTGTSSTITVDDGGKFAIGQWVLVPYSSQLYPCKITGISTNVLSLYPYLPGSPTSGSTCVNMENFYPTENYAGSFSLEHAKAEDSSVQYRLLGCIANGNIKISKGENLMFEADVKAADWAFGSLSISVAEGTNSRTAPMFANDAMVLLQPVATTTRTNYTLLSMDLKTEFSNTFLEEFGGVQGKTGPVRNGKRGIVELTVKLAFDPDQYARFDTKTSMFFAYAASKGTGTSKRFVVVDVGNCVFKDLPKISEDNGIMYLEGTLVGKLNTPHTTDLSRAPIVLAM